MTESSQLLSGSLWHGSIGVAARYERTNERTNERPHTRTHTHGDDDDGVGIGIQSETFPTCDTCGGTARPNIETFNDDAYLGRRAARQEHAYQEWLARVMQRSFDDVGNGVAVPTSRVVPAAWDASWFFNACSLDLYDTVRHMLRFPHAYPTRASLLRCARNNSAASLDLLLRDGRVHEQWVSCALGVACRAGSSAVVDRLLTDARVFVHSTHVTEACAGRHIRILQALLGSLRLGSRVALYAGDILEAAASRGFVDVVDLLLTTSCTVSFRPTIESVKVALRNGHADVVVRLVRDERFVANVSVVSSIFHRLATFDEAAAANRAFFDALASKQCRPVRVDPALVALVRRSAAVLAALDALVTTRRVCRDVVHAYVCASVTGHSYRHARHAHRRWRAETTTTTPDSDDDDDNTHD
jgi:hypothetical protein